MAQSGARAIWSARSGFRSELHFPRRCFPSSLLPVATRAITSPVSIGHSLAVCECTPSHTRGRPGSAEPEAAPENREICHENSQRNRCPCDYCFGGSGRILLRRLL